MSVGEEIRKARLAAEKTQEEVAFAAGIDRSYLSQLEHDHKSPTLDILFRICGAIELRASVLIARVERAENTSQGLD